MAKVYMFFANGFEEVEALTVVDLVRRAGITIDMVSITDDIYVTGSHGIKIMTDKLLSDLTKEDVMAADMLALPGGMPGTNYLKACDKLKEYIEYYNNEKKYLAAICAAPTVYGEMKLLTDKVATCYPGMENLLYAKEESLESVVLCDNFITSRGLGTAIDFALKIIEVLDSKEKADSIAKSVVYR